MKLNKKQIFMLYLACGYNKTIHGELKLIRENCYLIDRMGQRTKYDNTQFILRPSSDMTKKEKIEYKELCLSAEMIQSTYKKRQYYNGIKQYHSEVAEISKDITLKLCEWGIDIFGAIEKGWAVNQKELK